MDGRCFRKWWLAACLIPGALGCKTTKPGTPMGPPPDTTPMSGVPVTAAKKPFWPTSTPAPAVPIEVVEKVPKGPPKPDFYVAVANTQVELALDEKNPATDRQERLDAAREGYLKALQLDPKHRGAQLGLARYFARIGEREKSIDLYKKYLQANPSDKDVAHEIAVAHAQWKDWTGAIAWCDYALKMDPENLSARKTKAFCLARAGQWDQSLEMMRQVMPEAQARYLIARVMEHQNQLSGSRLQLELALKADPNFKDAQEFMAELDQATSGAAPDPNALRQVNYNEIQP